MGKFEKRLERDKKDLIRAIDHSHKRLDNRLAYLERKTKDQIFGLNQVTLELSFKRDVLLLIQCACFRL